METVRVKEVRRKEVPRWDKSGTTRLIKEYNRAVDLVKELSEKVDTEYIKARDAADLTAVFAMTARVSVAGIPSFTNDVPKGVELIRFYGAITNKQVFNDFLEKYGQCPGYTGSFRSVSYYRVNDVLCHAGGGQLVLKDHSLCSDEEWESMKEGNIPERLKF